MSKLDEADYEADLSLRMDAIRLGPLGPSARIRRSVDAVWPLAMFGAVK